MDVVMITIFATTHHCSPSREEDVSLLLLAITTALPAKKKTFFFFLGITARREAREDVERAHQEPRATPPACYEL